MLALRNSDRLIPAADHRALQTVEGVRPMAELELLPYEGGRLGTRGQMASGMTRYRATPSDGTPAVIEAVGPRMLV